MNNNRSNNKSIQNEHSQQNQNQTLITVLSKLTEKLSNNYNNAQHMTHQQIIIKLLQKIDPLYFQYKFSQQLIYDYEAIVKIIIDYYNDKLSEKIKKIFLIALTYTNKFQHVFQFVLDLAMSCNEKQKQRYIEEIINMSDRQKQILMPYVDEVMKRKFIQKIHEFHKYTDGNNNDHSQIDQLLEVKDQQYHQLRENYQDLARTHAQLIDNHNSLKHSFQKLLHQNTVIVQQKYELMNELGVHPSSSFLQIAQKFKKDVKLYQFQLQKLHKDLQDKSSTIKKKQSQFKLLTSSYKNYNSWQAQKQQMMKVCKKMENQLKQLQKKEQKMREQLQSSKILINKLKSDIQVKNNEISNLTKVKQRYKGLKEAHLQFKKNFVERMKQN